MLTAEQNELLTRVGPGTPCGDLMRRYWHPIAAVSELEGHKWNKRVRLLGEDLVLYRDKQGRMGLITEQCPHRRARSPTASRPTTASAAPITAGSSATPGNASSQPNEPEKSSFKNKVKTPAYSGRGDGRHVLGLPGPGREQAAAAAHRRLRHRRHHPHAAAARSFR